MPNNKFDILNKHVHVLTPLGKWYGLVVLYSPGSVLLQIHTGENKSNEDIFEMVQIISAEMVVTC